MKVCTSCRNAAFGGAHRLPARQDSGGRYVPVFSGGTGRGLPFSSTATNVKTALRVLFAQLPQEVTDPA